MEDAFGNIILSLILIFIFISGPIYNSLSETDIYINNYVKNSVNSFQKQVRDNGYLDIDTYNKFLNKLNKTRNLYKIQLIHSTKLVYPDSNSSSKDLYVEHGNKEILDCIYKNNQKYYMKYGDEFSINVTETKVEDSKKIKQGLYLLNNQSNGLISFPNGGMVQNEAN